MPAQIIINAGNPRCTLSYVGQEAHLLHYMLSQPPHEFQSAFILGLRLPLRYDGERIEEDAVRSLIVKIRSKRKTLFQTGGYGKGWRLDPRENVVELLWKP